MKCDASYSLVHFDSSLFINFFLTIVEYSLLYIQPNIMGHYTFVEGLENVFRLSTRVLGNITTNLSIWFWFMPTVTNNNMKYEHKCTWNCKTEVLLQCTVFMYFYVDRSANLWIIAVITSIVLCKIKYNSHCVFLLFIIHRTHMDMKPIFWISFFC